MSTAPHQLILFGPPGTSKSWLARKDKAVTLGIQPADLVSVTFHPDFSYGEFVARLLPLTKERRIDYSVHAGPFTRALARAYARLAEVAATGEPAANVLLLIDEINRGNCAEIFGDVFQLLDRDDDGWSSYEISTSQLVVEALRTELEGLQSLLPAAKLPGRVIDDLNNRLLRLPPNLFLIGTMNTSDESVYFMDSAFKRRWNFEFRSVGFDCVPGTQRDAIVALGPKPTWSTLLNALNQFILEKCTAPKLDDKLVGPWFIKARHRREISPTLAEAHPDEWKDLQAVASGVRKYDKGAEYSNKFDAMLLDLIHKLPAPAQKQALDFAQYDAAATRKFGAIAWNGDSFYYCSKTRFQSPPTQGTFIESFLEALEKQFFGTTCYEIDRTDIIGKLFLYLWDNVFDRDKSPLCAKLGLDYKQMRTFGQFVEHADAFIHALCPSPSETAATPT